MSFTKSFYKIGEAIDKKYKANKKKNKLKYKGKKFVPRKEYLKNLGKKFAKKAVKEPTIAELRFCEILDGLGVSYKFQHPIYLNERLFILDFVISVNATVVEIDGGYHNTPEQQRKDKERTYLLENFGYRVLRFTNEQVMSEPLEFFSKFNFYE